MSELGSVLAGLPDPVFVFKAVRDLGGTVVELTYTFLNEAGARLYGKSVDEVLGHGQVELFPSVTEVGIWDTYLGVIESGSPASFDVPFFHENGVEGSFRVTATKCGDGLLVLAIDTTAQLKAEKALEGDRAVLRATIDSLLDPHVRLGVVRDEDGQIIDFVYEDANSAACEYNKTTYEELIGTRLLDLLPGHVGTGLLKMYADVAETGEPLVLDDYVYPQELMSGKERHYDIRATRIAGNGLSYTWRDVTDRHVAAEADERLAAIVGSAGDGISSMTLEGIITSWNPASERLSGYSGDEVIGKFGSFLSPQDRIDEMYAIFAKIMTGEHVGGFETTIVRKDGSVVPVLMTLSPIHDADGRITGVSTVSHDLTVQKESIEVSRSMIEAALDPMVTISPEGKITGVNEATVKITGVPRDKLIGTSFSDSFTEPERAEEIYQRVLERGAVADFQLTLLHSNEHDIRIEVLFNGSVYRDARGNVIGVVASARDVTRMVEAQQDIADQQAREQARIVELERFQRLTVGREIKMIELKKEIEHLKKHAPAGGSDLGEGFEA